MKRVCRILLTLTISLVSASVDAAPTSIAVPVTTKENCEILKTAAEETCEILHDAAVAGAVHMQSGHKEDAIELTHGLCKVVKSWFAIHCPNVAGTWSDPFAQKTKRVGAPFFVAAVSSPQGLTRLDLSDRLAAVPLPTALSDWTCYIGDTTRNGADYIKQITCGSKAGFVDAFISCGQQLESNSVLRLRQPRTGSKAEWDSAEKITISVSCGYLAPGGQ